MHFCFLSDALSVDFPPKYVKNGDIIHLVHGSTGRGLNRYKNDLNIYITIDMYMCMCISIYTHTHIHIYCILFLYAQSKNLQFTDVHIHLQERYHWEHDMHG